MTELFERVLNTESFAGMDKETLIDALHEFKNAWNENQDVIFKLRENWRNAESDLSTALFKKDRLKETVAQLREDFNDATNKIAELKSTYEGEGRISVTWNIDDVKSVVEGCTDAQAVEVLDSVLSNHDANYGINWDTLSSTYYDLFE